MWQPIETAPKSLDFILLGGYLPQCSSDKWYVWPGFYSRGMRRWEWGGKWTQPTHWMPLPEPPK